MWGVECVLVPDFTDTDSMIEQTAVAMQQYDVHLGDKLVITAGVPFGKTGQTNLIQVHEIA